MAEQTSISRRTAFAGLGASGIALALAGQLTHASARRQDGPLADHPLVGVWVAMVNLPTSPGVPVAVPSIYGADGSVVLIFPTPEMGPNGLRHKGAAVGSWEAVDDRTGHFTVVQVHADADGNYLGTFTLYGHPTVSEDGSTFEDQHPDNHGEIRDPSNTIVMTTPRSPEPVRGYRILPGDPGFPDAEATPAT